MGRSTRILLAAGLLLVAALAAWGLYWLFFRPLPAVPVAAPTSTQFGQFPEAGQAGQRPGVTTTAGFPIVPEDGRGPYVVPGQIGGNRVGGAVVGTDGQSLQYYDYGRRQFVKLNPDGSITPLSQSEFFSVSGITWAPGKDKAILEYPDGTKVLYDFTTQQQATLPAAMQNFSFDPSGQKLASLYVGGSAEEQWLVVSNPDGSQIQLVEPISGNVNDFQVNWAPGGQVVALYRETVNSSQQQIIPVGRNGENFKSFLAPGRGFNGQWSPSGERLLYSVYTDQSQGRPQLYLADGRLESFGSNGLPLDLGTSADACSFGGGALYCVALDNPPALISQYPELAIGQSASVWQIDLQSGQRIRLAEVPPNITPRRAFTTGDGSVVYVEDSATGRLYGVPAP